MRCPHCNTPLDDETVFCGNCGRQIVPIHAQGATIVTTPEATLPSKNETNRYSQPAMSAAQARPYPPPHTHDLARPLSSTRSPSQRVSQKTRIFIASTLILLVLVVLGSILTFSRIVGTATHASAQVFFRDSSNGQGRSTALKINTSALGSPPSGSHYMAWLVDEQKEQTLALGPLQAQGQNFALDFSTSNVNLVGAGNKIEITQEQGNVQLPTGIVVLVGVFPPDAFIHIRHLLFSFNTTPGKVGLLVGLRTQAQLVNHQALLLKESQIQDNTLALQCTAQSIIDILEGASNTQAQTLPTPCSQLNITETGDGFGLLGSNRYIELAGTHASLAATQPDTTDSIKFYAQQVIIATDNLKSWVTTLDQDAHSLRASPNNKKVQQAIIVLGDKILNGVDTNGDQRVDPVQGEAGASVAYTQGQLMATLTLHP